MPAGPSLMGQSRHVMRDVQVFTLQLEISGPLPVAVDFLGVVQSASFRLVRHFADVTAAADIGVTSRAVRWGRGTLHLSGFSDGTSSRFASLFSGGSHALLQITEATGADSYAFLCALQEYEKALGELANRDSLTLAIEGVPYYQPGGGALLPMLLDA